MALAVTVDALKRAGDALIEASKAMLTLHASSTAPLSAPPPAMMKAPPAAKMLSLPAERPRHEGADGASNGGISLTVAERRLLDVLAKRHPKPTTKAQLAILAGYSGRSGSFAAALTNLRAAGLIAGTSDAYRITDTGRTVAGPVEAYPTGASAIDFWCRSLDKCPGQVLTALVRQYPEAFEDKAALAHVSGGYSPGSGSFAAALTLLRKLELLDRRQLKASESLMKL